MSSKSSLSTSLFGKPAVSSIVCKGEIKDVDRNESYHNLANWGLVVGEKATGFFYLCGYKLLAPPRPLRSNTYVGYDVQGRDVINIEYVSWIEVTAS